jgi:two-component system phosphate regulon sensor histidine kinase PhoR
MRKRHHKQILLFVIVLILPSILVTALGWTVLNQDRESRAAEARVRAEEARVNARAEIQRAVRRRLEDVRLQAVDAWLSVDPAVKFIAWVDDEKLIMPWETDPNTEVSRAALEEREFTSRLEDADLLEIGRRLDQAVSIYRSLIQSSISEHQRAYARRSLAAALKNSGAKEEASGVYRDLLTLPSRLVDEEGYPFASVAALALAKEAPRAVLARVARELESPAALTLDQAYRWRDVLNNIGKQDDSVRVLIKKVSMRISDLEAAQKNLAHDADLAALRKDFPEIGVTDNAWRPYRDLLVSRATAGDRRLVLAVRTADILNGVPFAPRIGGNDAEPLDAQYLPGLKMTFDPIHEANVSGLDLRRWFYAPSILLVICLNLFGGYLLWRDTRREVHLAELRSQFVSSVSHELKTPLTAIRMFAEILQRGESVDRQTHNECVDTIVNESERLTRLLNNVLDFSRIERGQKEYRMEPTRLADVVQSAARTMQYPLAEQGFDLKMDVAEEIPPVQADRDALKQAVLNLLTNAMKYSGQSRGIELRLFPQNGDALISVSDHGIGIPPEEQSRIFERFYRASVPENHSVAGTGLGLALVDHIVKGHGGSVQVESSPGVGSTFSIRLPIAAGEHS